MSGWISLLTALVSLALAVQVGRQYAARRKPYQLIWSAALLWFAIGAGCQFVAGLFRWTPILYRLWYLSGAILAAAYLGQGTVYLLARRWIAHLSMALLLLASLFALVMVLRAPVDLNQAFSGLSISGKGMPQGVRLLTPFFNIFGTLATVGGALISTRYFLWSGGSSLRAAGTACIAVGTLIVAAGGTLARFSFPEALYITELVGICVIFGGFSLTARPAPAAGLSPEQLLQRRKRINSISVGLGAATLLGAVVSLPILPWGMGIVTQVKHVYTAQVPAENRGAYLVTGQGVMQLYSWYVEPADFPEDAPVLPKDSIKSITIVLKQFDEPDAYQLYDLGTNERIQWKDAKQEGIHLNLVPDTLPVGEYVLVVPTDSMFGGQTLHYFKIK